MSEIVSRMFTLDTSSGIDVTVKTDTLATGAGEVPWLILAHGANNNLDFPLLVHLALHLAEKQVASVVRFNFPYVERGVTSPDARHVLEDTFTRIYEHVTGELAPSGAPVFVGGKSLGARTAVELVSRRAEGTGITAAGLILLGYPLHAMGREDHLWVEPLRHVDVPSLFFVGTRDPLCNPELLRPIVARLELPGTVHVIEGGDHSLHLRRASRRRPEDSYPEVAERVTTFIRQSAAR